MSVDWSCVTTHKGINFALLVIEEKTVAAWNGFTVSGLQSDWLRWYRRQSEMAQGTWI